MGGGRLPSHLAERGLLLLLQLEGGLGAARKGKPNPSTAGECLLGTGKESAEVPHPIGCWPCFLFRRGEGGCLGRGPSLLPPPSQDHRASGMSGDKQGVQFDAQSQWGGEVGASPASRRLWGMLRMQPWNVFPGLCVYVGGALASSGEAWEESGAEAGRKLPHYQLLLD